MMTLVTGNCLMRYVPLIFKRIRNAQHKTQNTPRAAQNAITFIELLLVIAIIGILIGISIPNFRKTYNSLQLNSFSRELQAFMNYLHQRSIVEEEIIHLNIDDDSKEYWASTKEGRRRLKTYHIPDDIKVETEQKEIIFYPDGNIDKVTIRLANLDNQGITLTTKGIFGGIKLKAQE